MRLVWNISVQGCFKKSMSAFPAQPARHVAMQNFLSNNLKKVMCPSKSFSAQKRYFVSLNANCSFLVEMEMGIWKKNSYGAGEVTRAWCLPLSLGRRKKMVKQGSTHLKQAQHSPVYGSMQKLFAVYAGQQLEGSVPPSVLARVDAVTEENKCRLTVYLTTLLPLL